MATTGAATRAPAEVQPEDRELIEQLAKLQNMHNQIHNLRGLLPERLLKPTKAALENPSRTSPAKLAASLRETAIQGSKDIRKFATDFRSESTQQLLQASNSNDFPQGRDAWYTDYERLVRSMSPGTVLMNSTTDAVVTGPSSEDANEVIKKFKEANSQIKLDSIESSSTFPLDMAVRGQAFRITREESNGKVNYQVLEQPITPSILDTAVFGIINDSGPHENLEVLLSMLASYTDTQFQPCEKCQSIFSRSLTYPLVRKRKPPTGKDDNSIQWTALHQNCD